MKIRPFLKSISATALASSAMFLAGCHASGEKNEAPEPKVSGEKIEFPRGSMQIASLSVVQPEKGKSKTLHLNGRLSWDEDVTVHVFTPFTGRISKIIAQAGQLIAEGAPLAVIASADYGQAQADARRAAVDYQQADRTLSRLKELAEHGAAAQKDVAAAEADYTRAAAEMERTKLRIALYGGNVNSMDHAFELKSPLSGTIVEKNINPGQEVRPDQMISSGPPLFVVTDPNRLWIQLDATEQDLPYLKPGQTIVLRSRMYPDQTFSGKIDVISDFIDSVSRTVKVRGSIDNSKRLLKAEMFVSVDLEIDASGALEVPAKAVFLQGDHHYLFVEEEQGRYARREVQIGEMHDGKIIVTTGLQSDQRVVADGSLFLEQLLAEGS